MASTEAPTLSLSEAAARAGVHYQTAYRWVRDGRLPATMVDGTYRVLESELQETLDAKTTPGPKSPPSSGRVRRQEARMRDALMQGDEASARRLGRRLVDEGLGLIDLVEQVLSPPLRTIGAMWREGELSISVEHRASAIVERLLGDVAPNPRGRRRGTIVVAAISGDRHTLPTTMAAVVLRERNWVVHQLGADLPVEALVEFCLDHPPVDAVVLSSTTPGRAAETRNAADRVRSLGIPALVGSPGATLGDLCDEVDEVTRGTS